jgi:hypothetical protein
VAVCAYCGYSKTPVGKPRCYNCSRPLEMGSPSLAAAYAGSSPTVNQAGLASDPKAVDQRRFCAHCGAALPLLEQRFCAACGREATLPERRQAATTVVAGVTPMIQATGAVNEPSYPKPAPLSPPVPSGGQRFQPPGQVPPVTPAGRPGMAVQSISADLPEGVILAPDERVVAQGTFAFSALFFFLHWKMAVTTKRLVGKTPNTILGIIPVGSVNVTYPLPNIAGVVTSTSVSFLWIIVGLIFLLGGIGAKSPVAMVIGLIALIASYSGQISINSGMGRINHPIAFFTRGEANAFVGEVNSAIATYAHQTPVVVTAAPAPAPAPTPVATSFSGKLAELTSLRDAGHLTAEEYEAKRREIIARL